MVKDFEQEDEVKPGFEITWPEFSNYSCITAGFTCNNRFETYYC